MRYELYVRVVRMVPRWTEMGRRFELGSGLGVGWG